MPDDDSTDAAPTDPSATDESDSDGTGHRDGATNRNGGGNRDGATNRNGGGNRDGAGNRNGGGNRDGAGDDGGDGDVDGNGERAERSIPDPRDGLSDPRENVPAAEAPTVSAPEVGVEGPDLPSTDEVPEDLRAEFWELVIAFNVALFALALGAMLVVLQSNNVAGAISLAIGTLALGYGLYQYRTREHTP